MKCPIDKEICDHCPYYEENHRMFDNLGPVYKPACGYYWPAFKPIQKREQIINTYTRFDEKQLQGINDRFRYIEQNYQRKKVRVSKYD